MTDDSSSPPKAGMTPDKDPEAAPDDAVKENPQGAANQAAGPRPSMAFLVGVSVVTLALDLWSKSWVTKNLDSQSPLGTRSVKIIDGFLSFISAKNRGGAWGLLQDESESIRKPFFMVISAAAVIFIVTLYRRVTPDQWALKWGLPLVLGGAIGNLIDRIRYGYVVDFIDVQVTKSFRWPTFNVADIAIVVGVALMAVDMFTPRKGASIPATKKDAATAAKDEGTAGEAAPRTGIDEDAALPPPADKA